ncbi:MAG: CoA-disulfide reductase, partial [Ruminococcaceae bacterium]|nr:CoA-disulfide reductase [Oscillospiraceae bacterium]
MKVIIVGGVAGGATAAARLRRLDEKAEIIIFERSGYVSYANCGLPYYIGGEIPDKEDLFLQTHEGFWNRFRIDVRTLHEVISINRDRKTVTVTDKTNGNTFEESYDKLILSPGAKPVVPDFCKGDCGNVFTLRTVEDTFKIREYSDNNNVRTATVIGGGFIGLEMAENLKVRGIDVTVIQRSDHLLNILDRDIASFIHANLRAKGINLLFGADVKSVDGEYVITDCAKIQADMVIVSIGVAPENTLAKDAGLKLGVKGAISVNDSMKTSDDDIYAVGDAVEVENFISKDK